MFCFVPNCTHYSEKHPCKFFSFPQNEKTLNKWIRILRCVDKLPSKSSRICSCHFKSGQKDNIQNHHSRLRKKQCATKVYNMRITSKLPSIPLKISEATMVATTGSPPSEPTATKVEKHSTDSFSTNMTLLTDKVESRKCSCEVSKSIDDPYLLRLLPVEYKYALCEFTKGKQNNLECKFRVNINSKGEALQWFEEFKYSSNTSYTKAKTFQEDTQGNVFKIVWKCIHNTRPAHTVKLPHRKHTNCPARLIITVKQTLLSKSYTSKDIHLQEYPMVVTLKFIHNHEIENLESLKFDTPDGKIQEMFLNYFNKGYPPSKAMNMFITDKKNDLIYENFSAYDLSICPDERWVYHFYYRVFRQENKSIYIDKQNIENLPDIKFDKNKPVNPFEEIFENMPETSEILLVDPEGNVEVISLSTGHDLSAEKTLTNATKTKLLGNVSLKPEPKTNSDVIEQLQLIFNSIVDDVNQQDRIMEAAKLFISNCKKIKSESSLISALSNFGEEMKTGDGNFDEDDFYMYNQTSQEQKHRENLKLQNRILKKFKI